MTKTERDRIIDIIANKTDYDASTVRIGRDGSVTAKLDPDKVPVGHRCRLLVARAADFADGANPFVE